MKFHLHCARTFLKQLDTMRRSGRKGACAADQCERIVELMRQLGPYCDALLCKRTKNGEYRLANCIKYNVSHGYRMVTISRRNHIFILFAGTHDKADQWLEMHRLESFSAGDPAYIHESVSVNKDDPSDDFTASCLPSKPQTDHYEQRLQAQLDEQLLRSIFSGLYR